MTTCLDPSTCPNATQPPTLPGVCPQNRCSLFLNPTHAVSLECNRTSSATGLHLGLFVRPSSLFSTHTAIMPLPNRPPPSSCAPAFTGHFSRWMHPRRRRTRLEATPPAPLAPPHNLSHEGLPCWSLRLKCAQVWSAHRLGHWRGRPSLARHQSFVFHLQIFVL